LGSPRPSRAALLTIRPAYDRVIAGTQADLATAPTGQMGAVTLPDGKARYASGLDQKLRR
jgi:uncharacterized protein (DUF885 family)